MIPSNRRGYLDDSFDGRYPCGPSAQPGHSGPSIRQDPQLRSV